MCEFYHSEHLLNFERCLISLMDYFELMEGKVPGIFRVID